MWSDCPPTSRSAEMETFSPLEWIVFSAAFATGSRLRAPPLPPPHALRPTAPMSAASARCAFRIALNVLALATDLKLRLGPRPRQIGAGGRAHPPAARGDEHREGGAAPRGPGAPPA